MGRVPRHPLALLVVGLLLAGCLADPAESDPPPEPDGDPWAEREALRHVDLRFQVISRAGGPVEIAGYGWWPEDPPTTVVLAVHGIHGNTVRLWGPADEVSGYSLGHRVNETGRAFVAIDLPGYGDSEGEKAAATLDDYAHVVAQVADHLRQGTFRAHHDTPHAFPVVIGLGWSLGGFVVVQTAGVFSAFDAIVPAGWSDVAFSDEARACISTTGPCPTTNELLFEPGNADPRVVRHFENNTPEGSPTLLAQALAWTPAADGSPAAQDVAKERVHVPVLWLLGDGDFYNRPSSQGGAEASFSGSTDVTYEELDATRHALFHHRNHDDVYLTLDGWLAARGW